jgi:ABC-2 type transport system permease protein
MTALLALVRKDLILFLTDRRRVVISLVLPIVIAAFIGYLIGGSGSKGKIDVALVQQDTSAIAAKIAAGLKGDDSLHITPMTLQEAQAAVGKGKQTVAVVLPAGFGEAAADAMFRKDGKPQIRLLYDPSQKAVLAMVKGMLTQQVMQAVSTEVFNAKSAGKYIDRGLRELDENAAGDEWAGIVRKFLVDVKQYQVSDKAGDANDKGKEKEDRAAFTAPFTTSDEQVSAGPVAQGFNSYAHSFSGMAVQFILFMGIDMGIGVLIARRSGVWNRLLASPVALSTVLVSRLASTLVIASGLMFAVFAVARLGFGVHIASVAGFVGVVLAFAAMTAGFGLLIAAFGKTAEAARGIAMFATLIMVMAGGAWMPAFLFPAWMQQVSLAMPTRWAVDGLEAVTWRGYGVHEAAPAMLALLGFALVFSLLAIWKFRSERA